MSMIVRYIPPKVDARVVLQAAVPVATHAAAEHILAVSQPLVPVDTGELLGSGKVTQDGRRAAVSYEGINAADDYDYGIRQHEDLALHHPNGGQAKFLEQPMHTEAHGVAELAAAELEKAISG